MATVSGGMLPGSASDIVRFPEAARPRLLFIVDAEEEFDWGAPFSRENTGVKTVAAQEKAQRIFDRHGVTPTYAIDYAVANNSDGYRPLLQFVESGACEIGAQLHAWVTPPFEEALSEHNSFANNLPPDLERRKLERLTQTIQENLGCKPVLYRAGRYGAGPATVPILENLGYEIDCSVLPGRPSAAQAPDYTGAPGQPYWLAPARTVLEIPVTTGDIGLARKYGEPFHNMLVSPPGRAIRATAMAARLRVFDRVRLTPEGSTLLEAIRLTKSLLRQGVRVFTVSYHSPSLVPGHTPYVRSARDLDVFLDWLDQYCAFFMSEALGAPSTPGAVRAWADELRSGSEARKQEGASDRFGTAVGNGEQRQQLPRSRHLS